MSDDKFFIEGRTEAVTPSWTWRIYFGQSISTKAVIIEYNAPLLGISGRRAWMYLSPWFDHKMGPFGVDVSYVTERSLDFMEVVRSLKLQRHILDAVKSGERYPYEPLVREWEKIMEKEL